MNARHRTKGPGIFLQMQAFLQVRGYVYLTGWPVGQNQGGARDRGPLVSPEMNAAPLPQLEVAHDFEKSAARLALRGELDMYSAPLLERELESAAKRRPQQIVLDLSGLSFMDVSGLRAILDAARRARREGGSLVIANPMPHIVRLLELTAIDQSVEVQGRPLSPVS